MSKSDIPTNSVVTGDSFDVLESFPSESVHAVVSDPPYGLNFMSRTWDDFEPEEYQAWCEEWATLALDVLKPGGHLLAFSGNRTHHRLFSGVEDAGFEVRDTLTWHYGSGFPKALDVSKAIDKAAGAEREVVGPKVYAEGHIQNDAGGKQGYHDWEGEGIRQAEAPATAAAKRWDGWKTALKPATEFIVLARKPFSGTVAENVQAHGTGALNVDACRIETDETIPEVERGGFENSYEASKGDWGEGDVYTPSEAGRYPANVIFDAEAAERLDREVGELSSNDCDAKDFPDYDDGQVYNGFGNRDRHPGYDDPGGPSRFYYTSKATRAERTLDGKIDNAHPTVKPIDLMEWLVRLVTAEGQTVLDPFAGTGTTGRAAKNLGRDFICIERDPKWADVARARCGLTPEDPSILTDDGQAGLSAYAPDG